METPKTDLKTEADAEIEWLAGLYSALPNAGILHYSLVDAAQILAIDLWLSGDIDGLTGQEWEGNHYHPKAREAIAPTMESMLDALIADVEADRLKAVVLAQSLPGAKRPPAPSFLPDQTFVHVDDLPDWMERYGMGPGQVLYDLADSGWATVRALAKSVAQNRESYLVPALSNDPPSPGDPVAYLNEELRVARSQIKTLERQIASLKKTGPTSFGSQAGPSASASADTNKRRTLLTVIAALCKKADIDLQRGAATKIASAVSALGATVGEDAIRAILKDIPEAVDSRSR